MGKKNRFVCNGRPVEDREPTACSAKPFPEQFDFYYTKWRNDNQCESSGSDRRGIFASLSFSVKMKSVLSTIAKEEYQLAVAATQRLENPPPVQLAKPESFTREYVKGMIDGTHVPSPEHVKALCRVLGLVGEEKSSFERSAEIARHVALSVNTLVDDVFASARSKADKDAALQIIKSVLGSNIDQTITYQDVCALKAAIISSIREAYPVMPVMPDPFAAFMEHVETLGAKLAPRNPLVLYRSKAKEAEVPVQPEGGFASVKGEASAAQLKQFKKLNGEQQAYFRIKTNLNKDSQLLSFAELLLESYWSKKQGSVETLGTLIKTMLNKHSQKESTPLPTEDFVALMKNNVSAY